MSGYTPCACRDCMDIAITSDSRPALCLLCKGAGCEIHYGNGEGGTECQREDAYGTECANGDGPCPNACQCGCESGTYECQCIHAYEGRDHDLL